MAHEEMIQLLPLTHEEAEALNLILSTLILARIDEKCDNGIAKALWQTAMPHIKKINEKINK